MFLPLNNPKSLKERCQLLTKESMSELPRLLKSPQISSNLLKKKKQKKKSILTISLLNNTNNLNVRIVQ